MVLSSLQTTGGWLEIVVLIGWTAPKRLSYVESNWPYFVGFGLPMAALTSLAPTFIIRSVWMFLAFLLMPPTVCHTAVFKWLLKSQLLKPAQSPNQLPITSSKHRKKSRLQGAIDFGFVFGWNTGVRVLSQSLGSLSKHDDDESENVIWKCDLAFLQSFFNYSNSLCLKNVF